MDVDVAADEVIRALRVHSNSERIAATLNYFPTQQENLGVAVPDLRKVARAHSKLVKGESARDVLRFVLAIIARNTLEGRQCAYEILAKHKPALASLKFADLKRLAKGVDNWVSVDCLACDVSGVVWREGQVRDADIATWSKSKDPWLRRLALSSTIPLNMKSRGGSGDVPRTIAVCERAVRDEHVMVHKALSWALRALIGVDSAAVWSFVEQHEDDLPALVKREVRKKLATGKKSG